MSFQQYKHTHFKKCRLVTPDRTSFSGSADIILNNANDPHSTASAMHPFGHDQLLADGWQLATVYGGSVEFDLMPSTEDTSNAGVWLMAQVVYDPESNSPSQGLTQYAGLGVTTRSEQELFAILQTPNHAVTGVWRRFIPASEFHNGSRHFKIPFDCVQIHKTACRNILSDISATDPVFDESQLSYKRHSQHKLADVAYDDASSDNKPMSNMVLRYTCTLESGATVATAPFVIYCTVNQNVGLERSEVDRVYEFDTHA